MWMWMVAAFIYYGFSFSWSSLGSNIYLSYLFAAVGEVIAYIVMVYPLEHWGRKPSTALFYIVGEKLITDKELLFPIFVFVPQFKTGVTKVFPLSRGYLPI
jgi:hypothetical protein